MRRTLKKVIDEDIDLDFLFYCYTSILNKSENEFWKSTPRKIFSQMDIYNKLNGKETLRDTERNISLEHLSNLINWFGNLDESA